VKFAIKINLSCLTVGVGPASIMVGNLVAGKRIAQASGRDLGLIDDQEQSRKVSQSLYLRNTIFNCIIKCNNYNYFATSSLQFQGTCKHHRIAP